MGGCSYELSTWKRTKHQYANPDYLLDLIQKGHKWGCNCVDSKDKLQRKPCSVDRPGIDCITQKHPQGNVLKAPDINSQCSMSASAFKATQYIHNLTHLSITLCTCMCIHACRPFTYLTKLKNGSDIQRLTGNQGEDKAWNWEHPGGFSMEGIEPICSHHWKHAKHWFISQGPKRNHFHQCIQEENLKPEYQIHQCMAPIVRGSKNRYSS